MLPGTFCRLPPKAVADAFPLVTGALICERVLIEKDEVISAIRIFDRVFYQVPLPPAQPLVQLVFLIMLKRGDASLDAYDLRVVIRSPSGREVAPATETPLRVEFPTKDPDSGVNVHVTLALTPTEEGLYWFEVMMANQTRSRTPLRMIPVRAEQLGRST